MLRWVSPFNPWTAGGRISPPTLRFFADSEKTAVRSAAKFAIAVQPTIWHISKKTMTRWHQRSRLQVTLSEMNRSRKGHGPPFNDARYIASVRLKLFKKNSRWRFLPPRFVGRSLNVQKKRQIPFDSWWCADSKNVIFIKIGWWPF